MEKKFGSSLFFIYAAVFTNIVAFTLVFPLLPVYAKEYNASDAVIGVLAASFAVGQLLFSPFWGTLSDRFGRKPVISWGLLGMTGGFLLFAVAPGLPALFGARLLQGVFSGATLPASRAYIADITTPKERVDKLGKLGAVLSLGLILGPAIGGLLAPVSLQLPFLAASVVTFFNFLFVVKFLPESIKPSSGHVLSFSLFFSQFGNLLSGLKSSLAPLFILSFLWSFSLSNIQVATPLLALERLNLGADGIGMFFAVFGAISAFVQFFLLSKITSRLGQHKTVTTGLLTMALGFGLMPFLPPSVLLFYGAGIFVGVGSAVSRPVITALISEETPAGQGTTMGIANAFESTGRLLGPLMAGALFSLAPFVPFTFSGLVVVSTVLGLLFFSRFGKHEI